MIILDDPLKKSLILGIQRFGIPEDEAGHMLMIVLYQLDNHGYTICPVMACPKAARRIPNEEE